MVWNTRRPPVEPGTNRSWRLRNATVSSSSWVMVSIRRLRLLPSLSSR